MIKALNGFAHVETLIDNTFDQDLHVHVPPIRQVLEQLQNH